MWYSGVSRCSLQQAAVFPDEVLYGIGFDKSEPVARFVPVAHRSEDGNTTDTQLEIQLDDFPNREFNWQCGRESVVA